MRNRLASFNIIMSMLLAFTVPAVGQSPAELDKLTGAYKATSIMVFHVRREGADLFLRPSGSQNEMGLLQQSANSFTDPISHGQFTFSDEGPDTVLTASHGITVFHAKRISEEAAKALEDAVAARVKANVPSPGTETSLRRYIDSLEKGVPNYDEMEPRVAEEARNLLPDTLAQIHQLGALKSLKFTSVSFNGMDLYDAEFEHGGLTLGIAPLDPEGKVEFRSWSRRN